MLKLLSHVVCLLLVPVGVHASGGSSLMLAKVGDTAVRKGTKIECRDGKVCGDKCVPVLAACNQK